MIRSLFDGEKYTTEELNARLKFFIGVVLGLTLFGIVFVVLYSLIFVTQPMNGMSPVDNKFFELIIPIATFLTGTLSGIMLAGDDKELRKAAIDASTKSAPVPVASPASIPSMPSMPPRPMTAAMPPRPSTPTVMSPMGVELEPGDPPVRNTRND
jgi:hypothetical protein